MAQYDKGRYYWIKLTDRFMTSDTVDFLMSQKDGANYVVLYQMLCLKTVNNNGVMARQLGEMIVPYDVDKIQRDCKWFSIDTVRIALELYKKLGLIYENNDGILAISDFDRMIGSQTYGAEKKELQKARGGTKVEIFPPDKEINRLREKENIEENIEIDSKKKSKRKSEDYEAEFEEIWAIYPRKEAKAVALKHYISARKSGTSLETIKQGLERYIEYCRLNKIEKKYIKNGGNWFKEQLWTNQYEITKGAGNEVNSRDNRHSDIEGLIMY